MKDRKKSPLDTGEHKKLIFVGPAAAGKTTFKRVFFDQVNPLKLLDEGLDPTRGIDNSAFTYFSQIIGVWDLAGQELDSWLGDRRDVFDQTSTIVCMMSASDALKDNISFLINFLKIKKEIAFDSDLFLLVNKCDLVDVLVARNMVINLHDVVRVKQPDLARAYPPSSFHLTSIAEPHFIKTMAVAFKIIQSCVRGQALNVPTVDLQGAEKRVRILVSHTPGTWFSMLDVSHKLSMSMVETHEHLEALRATGHVTKRRSTFYCISDKGAYIAQAIKQAPGSIKEPGAVENLALYLSRFLDPNS